MIHKQIHWLRGLSIGWLITTSAFAAPPDLTQPGVIAGINRSETYNLGATGMRGWIAISSNGGGDTGLITDQSRQILVTHCEYPANEVLAVDDVILGAMAANTGTVPDFTSDCRKAFATAIADAEKTGAGTLRVRRWRDGAITNQNIPITILGNYNATAPFNSCPKSTAILNNVRNKMVADLLADPIYLGAGFGGACSGLALLSGVKPGDPDYEAVRIRLETFARAQATRGAVGEGIIIWEWSYMLTFLSEYYLLTTDAQVVPGILNFTLALSKAQSYYGTFGHERCVIWDDRGRLASQFYGPVNAVGGTAMIALALGRKALVAAGQAIAPEIDAAINRGTGFFAFCAYKGSIPYGEHAPAAANHASNGKDAMVAVFFSLLPGREMETEYFSRMSIAGWIGREYGHTGQGLSYYWTALGALMGGPDAASEHLKQVRWHLDLSRRTDGSFAYDGREQFGPGTTSGNTYLGASGYDGMTANATYLLTYSMPLKRLWITGKNADPAHTLDSTKIANAVAAGSHRLVVADKTTAALFADLGEYDPCVRYYAAKELATRSLSGSDLTDLRDLLTSLDPKLRQSACQVLGLLQDATALPTIVGMLNDSDVWVRYKAAEAIGSYTFTQAQADSHLVAILNTFINHATDDPSVIDWNDPIEMSNGKLSHVLFGNAVDGYNHLAPYTFHANKPSPLYDAIRVGLRQPDSHPRLGVLSFVRNRLGVADAQALYPELADTVKYEPPADRMWGADCRAEAIKFITAMNITEGIPLALELLENQGYGSGANSFQTPAFNGIASYGDAARYTLPILRDFLKNPINGITNAIATIENAVTAPTQAPGFCVANNQVVTTTGAKAITLGGSSTRGAISFLNVTQPAHGTLSGIAPDLTYTPQVGYIGPDQFTFQTKDALTTSAIATVGIVVGPSGNGIAAEYFNNANFTSSVLTRTDPQINFDWGANSPHASISPDTFSTRWSGALLVPESTFYTFSALTSDGVRLYLNGQMIVDRFTDQNSRWTDSAPISLTAGQMVNITMEYYENTGNAVAKLKWIGPGFAGRNGDFIPQVYLFDGSGIANRPCYAFGQNLSTTRNTALPLTLGGSSGSGGTLSYHILSPPANGTLSGMAPNLTYTPNNNFAGTDTFTFLVNNGIGNSQPATIRINVESGSLTSLIWASAADGNWNDAARWTPSAPAAAGQANYAVHFSPTGTYTAIHNLNSGFLLNQLHFSGSITLAGAQSIAFSANGGTMPRLMQNSSGTVLINPPLTLQSTVTLAGNGNGQVTFAGIVSGAGGIIKDAAGTLRISQNNNTYSGGTTLSAGRVIMPAGPGSTTYALGTGPITLNSGAILELDQSKLTNVMNLNGGTIMGGNSFTSTLSGPVTLNNTTTINLDDTGGFEITGPISGSGGFTSTHSYWKLSGSNSCTGSTTIQNGWIAYQSAASVAPGPLVITSPGKANLNFSGDRVIASLTLGGVVMSPGTYGSSNQATYFTGTGTVTVLPPTTTALSLTVGSSPANPGTPLTYAATVTGASPTGDVQFYSGTTLLGTSALNGSFQATFTTSQLAIGYHDISARYVGNASNTTSTSSALVVRINSAPVAAPTNLTATPVSNRIDLSWSPSAGASSYYVMRSLSAGGPYTVIGNPTATTFVDTPVTNGISYFYLVSAVNSAGESEDSNLATASPGLAASTTSLSVPPISTGPHGTSVILTATVNVTGGPATGTVKFLSGSTLIGIGTLSSGTASFSTSSLPVAIHSITAAYEGNGSFGASISAPSTYQVTVLSQTITFPLIGEVNLKSPPFALPATASSGLSISYTSSNPYVATISGNTVTLLTQGSTTITAYQVGNTTYLAATPIARTLTVIDTNIAPVVNAGPDQVAFLTNVPWSPLTLTPQLWLDAADAATLTTNDTNVSQWADKSGFGRHATASGTAQPAVNAAGLNGKSVITLDGSSDELAVNLDFLAGVSHSAFVVTKPTSYSNIYGAANGGAGSSSLHVGFSGGSSYRMNYWGDDYYPAITSNFLPASANIMNFVWTSGLSKQVLANGKSEGANASAGVIGTMAGGGRIGNAVGHGFYGGDIAEIIFVTGTVTTADRERMEGYLAHKWGLTAQLPEAHPYKNSVPLALSKIANLNGDIVDADNDPLTITWSVISSPAPVTFGDTGAMDTTATFTAPGVYTFRLTSSDGYAQTSDDVVITVGIPSSYTVTFDKQNGSGGSDGVTAAFAGAMPTATAPTREGYTFGGYYTAVDGGGTQYYTAAMASASNWNIADHRTLYAQWIINSYTITFDSAGGSAVTAITQNFGATVTTPTNPTLTGYTFTSWSPALPSTIPANNLTVTAQWTASSYTVTFDKQSGSGGSDSVSATFAGAMPAATAPTRAGYTFGGYYTAVSGEGTQYYTAAMVSAANWNIADHTTLHAQWTNNAPTWTGNPITGTSATEGSAYSATLVGSASDVDVGASLSFAKVSGQAWLNVAANGALSGTPASGDGGVNSFTVSVSDGIAPAVQTTLNIIVNFPSFTWDTNASGNWTDTTNWLGNAAYASGINANATLDNVITAYRTITLDANRTIGSIVAADGTHDYTISGANILTLDRTGGAIPSVNVTTAGRALTISSVIHGNDGLDKWGAGQLILNGSVVNGFTGGVKGSSGTLNLNFANLATPTNLVNSSNTLTLGGGTLLISGNSTTNTNQTLGNVTVNAGGGQILVNPNGTSRTATLTLGSITPAATGTLLVGKSSASNGTATITTTSGTLANGIYGGGMVYFNGTANTGYDWATTASAGPVYTISGLASYTTLPISGGSSTVNYQMTASTTLTSGFSVKTLRMAPAAVNNVALDLGGNTLTVEGGGLLFTGSGAGNVINNGNVTAGAVSNYKLLIHNYNSQFNNTAASNPGINAAITNNGLNPVAVVVTGNLGGTTGLFRLGNTSNSFTGGLYLNNASIQLGGAGAINGNTIYASGYSVLYNPTFSTTSAIELADGAMLDFRNNVIAFTTTGAVTGKGGIVLGQAGGGATPLNFNSTGNTFTGPIEYRVIPNGQNGTLSVNSIGDAEFLGSGDIRFGVAGTGTNVHIFTFGGSAGAPLGPLTFNKRRFELAGTHALSQINNNSAQNFTINTDLLASGTGTMTLTLGGTGAGLSTFAGTITNGSLTSLGLTKADAGNWVLTNTNTYTGGTTVNAGTLTMSGATALGSTSGPLTVNGGTMNMTTFSPTVGNLTGTGGVISGTSGTRTLTIGQGDFGGGNYQGLIQNGAAGTTALTKTGTGTITLSGTNTYTGATEINVGTLFINGNQSSAVGNVSVAANATLGGTGTVGGSTTIAAAGKLVFNLSSVAASHNPLDLVAGKALTFSGASTLTITTSGGAEPGIYTLITGGDNIIGVAPATLNLPVGWAATVSISGNSLLLNVTSNGTYAVAYNTNGESSGTAPSNQTKNHDVALTLSTNTGDLARTGYTFTGWNTQADGFGTHYALASTYTANASVTLFAKWIMTFDHWSGGAGFGTDSNGDGAHDGMAWLLGAANKNTNAASRLPLASSSGGNLQVSFTCLKVANRGSATLKLQVSEDLGVSDPWTNQEAVVPDTSGTLNDIAFTISPNADPNLINVQASIPNGSGGKVFVRLVGTP